MERQEQTAKVKTVLVVGLLAALVIISWWRPAMFCKVKTQNQSQANAAGPTIQSTQPPNPLAQLLKLNTPVVNTMLPRRCSHRQRQWLPRNALEAASLFGGQPDELVLPAQFPWLGHGPYHLIHQHIRAEREKAAYLLLRR